VSAKYVVSLRAPFSANWSKSQHETLAGALSSAWRKYNKNYSVNNVSYEQKVIIDHEELAEAFTEMDNLSRERPKRQPYELAEHIIREIDAAITQDELWERMNFIRAAYAKGGARNL
jgi:hypothetical protein